MESSLYNKVMKGRKDTEEYYLERYGMDRISYLSAIYTEVYGNQSELSAEFARIKAEQSKATILVPGIKNDKRFTEYRMEEERLQGAQ